MSEMVGDLDVYPELRDKIYKAMKDDSHGYQEAIIHSWSIPLLMNLKQGLIYSILFKRADGGLRVFVLRVPLKDMEPAAVLGTVLISEKE